MSQANIPKTIHYIWFGNQPMPKISKQCIESWKKYCPDYEIKLWTEENFDVNQIPYCKQAYQRKKYAFVSDYARLYILYHYGGIYLDIDVEMRKGLDDLLGNSCFMGFETRGKVAPGLILGSHQENKCVKQLMEQYEKLPAFPKKKHNICDMTTHFLKEKMGLKPIDEIQYLEDVTVYPQEYFCASDWITRKSNITENTYCFHHYAGSWMNPWQKLKRMIRNKIEQIRIAPKKVGRNNQSFLTDWLKTDRIRKKKERR